MTALGHVANPMISSITLNFKYIISQRLDLEKQQFVTVKANDREIEDGGAKRKLHDRHGQLTKDTDT
jgi:hypothetical protein